MSEMLVQHARNLTKDTFEKLCKSTELALVFCRQRFFVTANRTGGSYIVVSNNIANWCYENCSDVYYIEGFGERSFSVFFLSEDDAALFKLTWCKDQELSSK